MTAKKAPLSPELEARLGTYQIEGLVDADFQPQGDFDHAKRKSIEARAYTNWVVKNATLCANRDVETVRSMFLNRHDPYWIPPEVEVPVFPTATPTIVGFDHAARALPRGDAWEEAESLFPEPAEVPPPPEV